MLKCIKRYELNEGVTIEMLESLGFRIEDVNFKKISFSTILYRDIELYMEILLEDGLINFDDMNNICVIDDSFCQPYTPFYQSTKLFPFLNKVIIAYNSFMDNLVEKRILKYKENEKMIQKVKK